MLGNVQIVKISRDEYYHASLINMERYFNQTNCDNTIADQMLDIPSNKTCDIEKLKEYIGFCHTNAANWFLANQSNGSNKWRFKKHQAKQSFFDKISQKNFCHFRLLC